jgi:hypothetical protein
MKPTHVLSSTAALITLLALGRPASAQAAPPEAAPPPPPPVVYMQPAPPPPGAVVVVAVPGQAPPGYSLAGAEPRPPADHPRFRFGIEAGLGYMFASSTLGSAHGPAVNLGLRLGLQINNPWAVYFQSSVPIGVAAGLTRDGTAVGGVAIAWNHGMLAEVTLGDMLHLGFGPSFDQVLGGICTNSTDLGNGTTTRPSNTTSCIGSAGAAFGMTGRIAATFGVTRPSRRKAFSLGLDLHPTFTPSGTFFFTTLNAGYEAF